jgi:glutathione S-transferase
MRLLGFCYSPFVAKVRKCLELKGLACDAVEVPYLDRRQLVALTDGSVHVPVLEDGGRVITESARITAYLDERYAPSLRGDPLAIVLESWADSILEDVAFRLAAPGLEARMAEWNGGREDAAAMFRVVKERKFGAGCVDAWRRESATLSRRTAELLAPLAQLLATRPFLLGEAPSLADAALYGQLHMVEAGSPGWIAASAPALRGWWERIGGEKRR